MNLTAVGILNFLINITQREFYESLVFVSSSNPRLAFEDEGRNLIEHMSKAIATPVISLTYTSSVNITNNFNGELLTIVDLQSNLYAAILAKVELFLHLTTKTRVLLILDHDAPNEAFLDEIFQICWQRKLINVIAIFRDFSRSQEFYSYVPYPSFHLEKKSSSSDVIYPNRVMDLKGSALRVFADQIEPLDMLTQKPNGQIELFGYVGHIISAFARKHNATLDYAIPFMIGKTVFFAGLRELLFNDTLDLLISLTVINVSCVIYSYTVEQTSYCMMLPVEKNIPTSQFYIIIMEGPVLGVTCLICFLFSVLLVTIGYYSDNRRKVKLIDIFLNDSCIRGLLSQSFNILKSSSSTLMFIYFLLSMMGMYFTTWYLAYLQSYLTHPPIMRRIENFSDVHGADFKVNLYYEEFIAVEDLLLELMDRSVFKLTRSYVEFLQLMGDFNSKYSYMIPASKWNIFKGQQELFAKPLFRTSDMCVVIGLQMGFPIHPNSVLKDALNRVIMQVQDSGLLKHWMGKSFQELVQIGRMNFTDWSNSDDGFKQLRVNDLCWVFAVFYAAHCISLVVFAGELIAYKIKRVLERRRVV